MDALIDETWSLYRDSRDLPCVVRPSMPILYFGDHERYLQSPLKIVTVALNPSRAEFPAADPFRRFRKAERVDPDMLVGESRQDYLAALNDYFREEPYLRWFRTFRRLLDGMDAAHGDGRTNTTLHTNLGSPLATDPTWSKLAHERAALGRSGARLWLALARCLAPDVILVSVARRNLEPLEILPAGDWETIYALQRAIPYEVEAREIEIAPGKRTALVFGRAYRQPFAGVDDQTKFEIGRHVADWVNRRRSR